MQKKIKQWYDRHKQKVIIGLVMVSLIILCVGVIVRGVHTMRSDSESDSIQINNISFSLVNPIDTTTFSGQTKSDDKLYREREERMPSKAPSKEVDISFDAVFAKKEGIENTSTSSTAQYSEHSSRRQYAPAESATASIPTEERQRVKQALDEIYKNGDAENNSNKNVTNNTHSKKGDSPQKPPTQEELLAQRKKLMEEGFDKQHLAAAVTPKGSVDNIYISSPEEIPAFIHGAQTVKNNNRLALRIDAAVMLSNGQVIPRNTIIYGTISISNNRVLVSVESIKYRTMNYVLPLVGFAEDGMPGLPVESQQNQKIVEDASSSAVASALDRTISSATGGLVGSVVRDISNASRNRKESYVSFIDNRRVFLHPLAKK